MKWPKLNSVIFGLNLGLLVAVCIYLYNRTEPQPAPAPEPIQEATAPDPEPIPVIEKLVTQTVMVTNQLSWRQLESEDYRDYINRLRSIGCPEQTIRDLIIADLDKLFAPSVQALQGRRKEPKYWDSEEEELANDINRSVQEQQQRAIDREKRRIIEELLGIDLVRERLKQKGEQDYYERRLAFLPEQKRDLVRQILEDYDQQEQLIRSKETEDGLPITPADQAELRRLEQEKQARLTASLSPDEVTQMDLWLSPSANAVRHDFYGMNATEEEFQAIYQLRKNFDQKWAQQDPQLLSEAWQARYQQEKAELEKQVKQQLGDQRYAEYQRGSDEDFHRLSTTAARFNLPRQTAAQVYELKRTLQSMTQAVRSDPNLAAEQKERALQAMLEETKKEAQSLLGETAYKYYVWRGQAYWLTK